MNEPLHLLAVIAFFATLLDHQLRRGQVGTMVEVVAADVFAVEFSDDQGGAMLCWACGLKG